jgi:hypothetical protein
MGYLMRDFLEQRQIAQQAPRLRTQIVAGTKERFAGRTAREKKGKQNE